MPSITINSDGKSYKHDFSSGPDDVFYLVSFLGIYLHKLPDEILELDYAWGLSYLKWIRITEMSKSEDGLEALETAWLNQQDGLADLEGLDRLIGKMKSKKA